MKQQTHIALQSEAIWFIVYGAIVIPSLLIDNNLLFIGSILLGLACAYKVRKWYRNREMSKLLTKEKK